jgi:hypothetical protein
VESVRVVCRWSRETVVCSELKSHCKVEGDKGVVETTCEAIDISHHASRSVENLKMIPKQLLGPAADLMNGTFVFKNFLDGTTVAHPIEFGSPKIFTILADGPTTTASFANERVEMALHFCASSGTESDGSEAGAVHGYVEVTNALGKQKS